MDLQGQNGLLSTYREGWRNRGLLGMAASALLVGLYLLLYFQDSFDATRGVLDGPAQSLGLRNRWYLYGAVYTLVMIAGAVYYLRRHGNSRYNRLRIGINVAVQLLLGFTLPFVMPLFGQPEFYFSYLWPLKIEYLYPSTLEHLPLYLVIYAVFGSLVGIPLLVWRYGKRFYCSWVCGCGGLANTFGDPWRHLTSTSSRAWRFERATLYPVMVLSVVLTVCVGVDYLFGDRLPLLHSWVGPMRSWYGFVVGSILAGVVGTGLYPVLGPRVWCRNFCPMAAMLGLIQRLGRFRIRVKQDMCISCGNCSTYCEMGIDVRAYAQRNESFTRASCVGCGMCAHVCPRGVLRLENARPSRVRRLPMAPPS